MITIEITGYCKFFLCIKYISNFGWHIKSGTNNMQVFMYSNTLFSLYYCKIKYILDNKYVFMLI